MKNILKAGKSRIDKVVGAKKASRGASKNKGVDFAAYAVLIEKKAYELFLKRGCQHGRDQEDWFEAEKLIEEELCCK